MKNIKSEVVKTLTFTKISKKELNDLIEIPKDSNLGDFAFPCFVLGKRLKKNPNDIAKEIAEQVDNKKFEKVNAVRAYVNFFISRKKLAEDTINEVRRKRNKYGTNSDGKGKLIVVEMSSPNIAKPFGIGHLRSTIIGNSIANICEFNSYKVKKINYLGDWGTQFGKLILGFKKWGSEKKLTKEPIKHMFEIYVKANKKDFENDAREWFKRLEDGDKEAIKLWRHFRERSLRDFNKLYKLLGVKFDAVFGESDYNKKMEKIVKELERKKITKKSQGALIIDLEKEGLGISLIKKKDDTTLYITRDLAAAIDRYEKYKFHRMIYEVGAEQKLHFKQLFKILEILGYNWANKCIHVEHGLYLGNDGKKFSTRKGKTVFMEEVLSDIVKLAKKEIEKRERLNEKELDERAKKIAIAALFYGDLKNHRSHDIIFDIERFLNFEGDTGPYLLYSYARAQSILRKAKSKKKIEIGEINEQEKKLISEIARFPEVVKHSHENLAPNIIANYSYELAKAFSDFYHSCPVLNSEEEAFRLSLVKCFAQVMKNALNLLGIKVIGKM